MLAIGDCLQSRYRVVRQLGHGGMGTVYEAHDERFENSVALKEVLIDLAKIADPVQQQMVARAFEREAKTLALLHHEAFPHVIDYFSERDHQYLIMELIRGEDLGEQLQSRKKPFEFEDVLEWTKQLLDALDYLHTREQPIIHRDLKPQNMKITARGKVKVLDFGIAKGADNKSSSTITNQTFVAATLNYSPIEQLLRVLDPTFREFISQRHKEKVEDILEHTADARSDLYSLGATLYQLLTATQPHDTLKRALDIWAGKPDPLPNPMELNPKIPPYFNNILLKSMEIDRDSRFVSAADMQQALKSYLENESRTESEFKQAAWIAEQQRMQTPPPDIGMQTQIRIAEEMKFLDELASPETSKTENMPAANQQPFVAPPTAPPFSLPTNESDERRRIAEQQKFLADLDAPNSPPVNQAPVQQSDALTNYGQAAMPLGQQADQTNYAPQQNNSQNYDQTQVSYLADVLPAPQAKAVDATVINPQVRNDAPVFQTPEPAAAAAPANKLVWLVPVGAVGALLLIGILAFVGYKVVSGDSTPTPTPTKTPYVVVDTTPTPVTTASPTDTPATTENNLGGTTTPSTTTTTTTKTNTPKPTPAVRENSPQQQTVVRNPEPSNPTPRVTQKPQVVQPSTPKPPKGCTAEKKAMGEC